MEAEGERIIGYFETVADKSLGKYFTIPENDYFVGQWKSGDTVVIYLGDVLGGDRDECEIVETWYCAQCGNDTSVPVRRDEFPCQGSIIQETAFCSSECYELWLKKQIPQTDLGGYGD